MNAKHNALNKAKEGKFLDSSKFKNKHGYHIVMHQNKTKKYFPKWGRLDPEYASTQNLMKKHNVPKSHAILTHSVWAKHVMKKYYDRFKGKEK